MVVETFYLALIMTFTVFIDRS